MPILDKLNVKITQGTLKNGVGLYLLHRKGMPVTIEVRVLAGSRNDPQKKLGTAHFLEHMLLVRTEKFKSKDKLAAYIEEVGGFTGASTSGQNIVFRAAVGDQKDVEKAIVVLSQELCHPVFSEKEFENERKVIIQELKDTLSNPKKMLSQKSYQNYMNGTDREKPTLGTEETLRSMKISDLQDFMNKYFTGKRTTFIVSGGVEYADLKQLLEKYIILPSGQKPNYSKPLPVIRKKYFEQLEFKKESSITFNLVFRPKTFEDSDHVALAALVSILNGRSGTLKKLLRYRNGLVYFASAGHIVAPDYATFGLSASIQRNDLSKVLKIIWKELNRFKLGKVSNSELAFVKKVISKSKLMQLQTSQSLVESHSYYFVYDRNTKQTIDTYLESISKLNVNDLTEVANKYIQKDNWYFASTGSEKPIRVEEIEKLLR